MRAPRSLPMLVVLGLALALLLPRPGAAAPTGPRVAATKKVSKKPAKKAPKQAAEKAPPEARKGGRAAGSTRGVDLYHKVRSGESLWTIARKYGTTVKDLKRLNGDNKARVLRIGQALLIQVRDPVTLKKYRPYLHDWGRMEQGEGYVIKRPGRSYGRPWAIALLAEAIADLHARFPGSAPVVVGDWSGPVGGYIPRHLSHKTGRDVDLGYFCPGNPDMREFERHSPDTIDVEKSWSLIEALLRTGRIEFMFMEYALQARFRAHAASLGYPEDELDALFQYPRAPRTRVGIIRHAKGHATHVHVRFVCPADDRYCR